MMTSQQLMITVVITYGGSSDSKGGDSIDRGEANMS